MIRILALLALTACATPVITAETPDGHRSSLTPVLERYTGMDASFLRRATDMETLRAVNERVNLVRYVTDQTNYGVSNYWATPDEFLKNGGDCEDYAIAKYFALRSLGFTDMRIVTYTRPTGQGHAVLVVKLDGWEWALDNATDEVKAFTAKPVYSANADGYWLH